MARAAKVPTVVQEFRVQKFLTVFSVLGLGDRYVAHSASKSDADNIAAALNLWMAIERGELIVKEAE